MLLTSKPAHVIVLFKQQASFKKHVAVSELIFGVGRQNRYESSTVDSVVTGRGAVLTNNPL